MVCPVYHRYRRIWKDSYLMTTSYAWSKSQVRTFSKELRKYIGPAWNWMVPDVKRALISEKVLSIVLMQARSHVAVEDISVLYRGIQQELMPESTPRTWDYDASDLPKDDNLDPSLTGRRGDPG